ncbi:MAG: 5'-3' exonuclease H3TH domain-containing protein, partial [Bacteriovoracaceae bacterium]
MKRRLIIVDISSFIFRAFFAIRPMSAPDGRPTNAVYGVLTMLMKLIQSQKPSHIVLALDCKGKSFRNDKYELYKANRGEAPEDLVPQFAMIAELIDKLKIPQKCVDNYEADDVIGSIVVQHQDAFDEIFIASSDKDLMQFVNGKVKMLDTMKNKLYGAKEVYEKMGVHPDQIMDYLSLVGDSSDNIPGVKGIGAKGAAKLLEEHKTLDNILKNKETLMPKRCQTALANHEEDAHVSRELVKIVIDLDLDFHPEDFKYELKANEELLEYLTELNFKTVKSKLAEGSTDTNFAKPQSFVDYASVKTKEDFEKLLETLRKEDQLFIEPFFKHNNYHKVDAPYLTVATGEKSHVIYCEQVSSYLQVVKEIMSIDDVLLVGTNMKSVGCVAAADGMNLGNIFDIQQAHFVVDPDKKHDLASIAKELLDENVQSLKDLKKESLEQEASVRNFEYGLAKRAFAGIRVYPWLIKKLKENELFQIYEEIDMPLIPILSQMEMQGICLDRDFYAKLEKTFSKQTENIEKEIQKICG